MNIIQLLLRGGSTQAKPMFKRDFSSIPEGSTTTKDEKYFLARLQTIDHNTVILSMTQQGTRSFWGIPLLVS